MILVELFVERLGIEPVSDGLEITTILTIPSSSLTVSIPEMSCETLIEPLISPSKIVGEFIKILIS